jgi:hypothetical protein
MTAAVVLYLVLIAVLAATLHHSAIKQPNEQASGLTLQIRRKRWHWHFHQLASSLAAEATSRPSSRFAQN